MLEVEHKRLKFLENKAIKLFIFKFKILDIIEQNLSKSEIKEYKNLWLKYTSPTVERGRYNKNK